MKKQSTTPQTQGIANGPKETPQVPKTNQTPGGQTSKVQPQGTKNQGVTPDATKSKAPLQQAKSFFNNIGDKISSISPGKKKQNATEVGNSQTPSQKPNAEDQNSQKRKTIDMQSASNQRQSINVRQNYRSDMTPEEIEQMNQEMQDMLFQQRNVELKGTQLAMGVEGLLDIGNEEDTFEIQNKDKNGRTILHRTALQQNYRTIMFTLESFENNPVKLKEIVEQKDNYGNTPLGLACVYGDLQQNKQEFTCHQTVKFLIDKGKANINTFNPSTHWTPLHWAARYGDIKTTEELLQKNAQEYLPDKKGFYPIDYAGFFEHQEVVSILINHTLEKVKKNSNPNLDIGNQPFLILRYNSIFHTSILYWAARCDKFDSKKLQEIMAVLEAYPEGPVGIHRWRTPIHAAAQVGDENKLKELLINLNQRYSNKDAYDIHQRKFTGRYQFQWGQLLQQQRFYKTKNFFNNVFMEKLKQYNLNKVPSNRPPLPPDFEDKLKNTPLHLASQNGKDKCVNMLIQEYRCNIDIRNSEGWMPKDLVQHANIYREYSKWFKRWDKEISKSHGIENNDIENSAVQQNSVSETKKAVQKPKQNSIFGQIAPSDIQIKAKLQDNLQEREVLMKGLLKCRDLMPQIPHFALKVNVEEKNEKIVDRMIMLFQDQGFTVQMFQSVYENIFYICIDMPQSKLEESAQKINLRVKLVDFDVKQVFEPGQKIKFEPFRTKDIQTIIYTSIQKIINIQSLTSQGIILAIIPLHDYYGIHEIKAKWEQKGPRFLPMPFPIIKQFYKEGINIKFEELSTIKNYFGEKTGFYYAWLTFYSSQLLQPAFFALAITIYQIIIGVDTIWTAIYAVFVSVWITIFIESWKRKSSEISSKWGIFEYEENGQRSIRQDYNGDEYFSHIRHDVDKKRRSIKAFLSFFFSIPIFIIMIGFCIAVFFGTKYYKDNRLGGKPMTLSVYNGLSFMTKYYKEQQIKLNATIGQNATNTTSAKGNSTRLLFRFDEIQFQDDYDNEISMNSVVTRYDGRDIRSLRNLQVNTTDNQSSQSNTTQTNATSDQNAQSNTTSNQTQSQSNTTDQTQNTTNSNTTQPAINDTSPSINNDNSTSTNITNNQTANQTVEPDQPVDPIPNGPSEIEQRIASIKVQNEIIEKIDLLVTYQKNKNYKLKGKEQIISVGVGIVNSLSIALMNSLYTTLARITVVMENHKYAETYESSFVYKLFIFKFVNTNLQLFYTAFIEQNYVSLYYLIVGFVIQKSIQILLVSGLLKFLLFWKAKRSYFKKIKAQAINQIVMHNYFKEQLNQDEREQINLQHKQNAQRGSQLYSVIPEDGTNPSLQRVVLNIDKYYENKKMLIDAVEVNNLMGVKTETAEINEISEEFIFFGMATLYAAACPIVTFLVLLHTLVTIKVNLYINYSCVRRNFQETRQNIGPWFNIANFMAIFSVVTNMALLYFSSPRFKSVFLGQFKLLEDIKVLWVLIGVEHAIIILKFFLEYTIKDRPNWVDKAQQKIEFEIKKLEQEEDDRKDDEKFNAYKNKMNSYFTKYNKIIDVLKQHLNKQEEELKKKDALIKSGNLDGQQPKIEKKKTKVEEIRKEIEDSQKVKNPDQLKLVDFIGVSTAEWHGKEREVQLEKALSRNLQMRLFRLTFNGLEKDILAQRITRLYSTKKQIAQINCAECSKNQAIIECKDCGDHFCKKCSDQIHASSQVFLQHRIQEINITQYIDPKLQNFMVASSQQNPQTSLNGAQKGPNWKKFEYFNFPIQPGNDQYSCVQKHFIYLRQQYIEKNFIQGADQIDYKSLFVDGHYDLLTETQGNLLQLKNSKTFGTSKDLDRVKDKFNDEELFYMNRIAFYLFRFKGENLTFANFVNRLDILQSEKFSKRVTLWLSILDEGDSQIIEKEIMSKIFKISFVSDINQSLSGDDIVEMIYAGGPNGKDDKTSLTIQQLVDIISKNEAVKGFMRCILQSGLGDD